MSASESRKNNLVRDWHLVMDWRSSRNKRWIRAVAILVVICFINQDILWAQGGAPVSVPRQFAETTESFAGSGPKTIIHIQDAHASLGAQESIVSILDSLAANYDVNIVAVEGSSGYIDTSLLKSFPDENIRKKTADYMVRNGRMSAGEFFAATSNKPIALYGIEDKELYLENLEQFRKIHGLAAIVDKEAARLIEAIKSAEEEVYSEDLKKLEQNSSLHEEGKITFASWWEHMSAIAAKFNVDYKKYGNVSKLAESMALEKAINFEETNRGRDLLIDTLTKSIAKDRLKELIVASLAFKRSEMAQYEYYHYLETLAKDKGIDPKTYKSLTAYMKYVGLYESIDLNGIFSEIKEFEDAVRERAFQNDRERKLNRLSKCAKLIRGLFGVKLTNNDARELELALAACNAGEFKDFIREGSCDPDLIFENIPAAMEFYKTAEQRNSSIIANTIKRMDEEGRSVAALITGGFHTKGLAELLKSRQTSYVVIFPKIDQSKGERPYVAVLTNKNGRYNKDDTSGPDKVSPFLKEIIRMNLAQAMKENKDIDSIEKRWLENYTNAYNGLKEKGIVKEPSRNLSPLESRDKERRDIALGDAMIAAATEHPEGGGGIPTPEAVKAAVGEVRVEMGIPGEPISPKAQATLEALDRIINRTEGAGAEIFDKLVTEFRGQSISLEKLKDSKTLRGRGIRVNGFPQEEQAKIDASCNVLYLRIVDAITRGPGDKGGEKRPAQKTQTSAPVKTPKSWWRWIFPGFVFIVLFIIKSGQRHDTHNYLLKDIVDAVRKIPPTLPQDAASYIGEGAQSLFGPNAPISAEAFYIFGLAVLIAPIAYLAWRFLNRPYIRKLRFPVTAALSALLFFSLTKPVNQTTGSPFMQAPPSMKRPPPAGSRLKLGVDTKQETPKIEEKKPAEKKEDANKKGLINKIGKGASIILLALGGVLFMNAPAFAQGILEEMARPDIFSLPGAAVFALGVTVLVRIIARRSLREKPVRPFKAPILAAVFTLFLGLPLILGSRAATATPPPASAPEVALVQPTVPQPAVPQPAETQPIASQPIAAPALPQTPPKIRLDEEPAGVLTAARRRALLHSDISAAVSRYYKSDFTEIESEEWEKLEQLMRCVTVIELGAGYRGSNPLQTDPVWVEQFVKDISSTRLNPDGTTTRITDRREMNQNLADWLAAIADGLDTADRNSRSSRTANRIRNLTRRLGREFQSRQGLSAAEYTRHVATNVRELIVQDRYFAYCIGAEGLRRYVPQITLGDFQVIARVWKRWWNSSLGLGIVERAKLMAMLADDSGYEEAMTVFRIADTAYQELTNAKRAVRDARRAKLRADEARRGYQDRRLPADQRRGHREEGVRQLETAEDLLRQNFARIAEARRRWAAARDRLAEAVSADSMKKLDDDFENACSDGAVSIADTNRDVLMREIAEALAAFRTPPRIAARTPGTILPAPPSRQLAERLGLPAQPALPARLELPGTPPQIIIAIPRGMGATDARRIYKSIKLASKALSIAVEMVQFEDTGDPINNMEVAGRIAREKETALAVPIEKDMLQALLRDEDYYALDRAMAELLAVVNGQLFRLMNPDLEDLGRTREELAVANREGLEGYMEKLGKLLPRAVSLRLLSLTIYNAREAGLARNIIDNNELSRQAETALRNKANDKMAIAVRVSSPAEVKFQAESHGRRMAFARKMNPASLPIKLQVRLVIPKDEKMKMTARDESEYKRNLLRSLDIPASLLTPDDLILEAEGSPVSLQDIRDSLGEIDTDNIVIVDKLNESREESVPQGIRFMEYDGYATPYLYVAALELMAHDPSKPPPPGIANRKGWYIFVPKATAIKLDEEIRMYNEVLIRA